MKYYGYLRVSTEAQGQKETSLIVQEQYLKKQAELLSLEFVAKREVQSGKNLEGRSVLTELLKTLGEGDVLGVYDDSRLSRNTGDSIKIAAALANKGAKLQIGGKFIDVENPTEEFSYIINSAVAQYQRKIQNAKARASQQLKRESGNHIVCGNFFGYTLQRKKGKTTATINEEEARKVKYIYDAFLKDKNIKSIAVAVGTSTTRVKDILTNPLYMGKFSLAKGKRTKDPSLITDDTLIKSNVYPPIIDEDTFWKAVQRYKKFHKPRDYAYRKSLHVLTGVYKSSCCGIGLVFSHFHPYNYYSTTNHSIKCVSRIRHQVRETDLELITQALMLITLKSGIEVSAFYAEQRNLLYGTIQEVREKIIEKEKEVKNNALKLQRLLNLAAETDISVDVFKTKINEIKNEEDEIKNEIVALRATVAAQEGSVEELIEAENEESIEEFLEGDNEQKRNFYIRHIKSAVVYEDHLEVLFTNLKRFIVEKRTTRSPKYTRAKFEMFFGNEEQASGFISLIDGSVSFNSVEAPDDVADYLNSYYEKLAEEVNELI